MNFVQQVTEAFQYTVGEDYVDWFHDAFSEYDEELRNQVAASMAEVEPLLLTDVTDQAGGFWIANGLDEESKYIGSPATFAWLPVRLGAKLHLLVPSLIASGDDGIAGYASGLLNAVPRYLFPFMESMPPVVGHAVMPVHSLTPPDPAKQLERPQRIGWMPPAGMALDDVVVGQLANQNKVPVEFAGYPNVEEILAIFLSSFTRAVAVACLRKGVDELRSSLPQLATCMKSQWQWYADQIRQLED